MRNSSRIKCLILGLSLLAFIYLLVFNFSTPADHKEFQEYLMKLRRISGDLAREGWDDMVVGQWKKSLEIRNEDDHSTTKGECKFHNVVIALPGDSLEEHLWEYLSLLVIRERWKKNKDYTFEVFLAPKTHRELGNLLEHVHIEPIQNYPTKCLDLRHSKILGHVTPLEPVRIPSSPQVFILEKGTKRYKNLVKTDLDGLRKSFVMNQEIVEIAQSRMLELRSSLKGETSGENEDVFVIGLHLGVSRIDGKVPLRFYKDAIEAAQSWFAGGDIGMMLICPDERLPFCKEKFQESESLKIIPATDDFVDFALLTLCDGNIVHSNLGFVAAILNGGKTAVYQLPGSREYDPAIFVAQENKEWIVIK